MDESTGQPDPSAQTEPSFDFDTWLELARRDPDALEAKRQAEIDRLLNEAPIELRARLEGLQWQIDMVRRRADTPLGACVEISEMMWEQILGPNGLVTSLCTLSEEKPEQQHHSATILAFPLRNNMPTF